MRKCRLLRFILPGIVLGAGLDVAMGACGDDDDPDPDWDEADNGEHPGIQVPQIPPVPPGHPAPPGTLTTHYFEVPVEGADRLEADLELALGRVETARAERGYLFQAEVMLPEGRLRPRFAIRRSSGTAHVSLNLDDAALSPRG